VDRFGNLITNIDRERFDAFAGTRNVKVSAGGTTIGRIVATYADMQPAEVGALFGSTERLEISPRGGSASKALGLSRGAAVVVRR
jgi:S-adenosylmethionine hydrolase